MSMATPESALVWLRRDLRTQDHRALYEATHRFKKVLPVFILDSNILKHLEKNDRRITFIQDSLDELNESLGKHGSRLVTVYGDPEQLVPQLAKRFKVNAVFAARDYEPYAKKRDTAVAKSLQASGVEFQLFKDQVIFEQREILNGSNEPYRVFTPYSNAWLKKFSSGQSAHLKEYAPQWKHLWPAGELREKNESFWEHGFERQEIVIPPGEKAARKTLKGFTGRVGRYHEDRDFPAIEGTSRISMHLRFGTISIREVFRFAEENLSAGAKIWIKELIWREFYQMILDQFPHVAKGAFKKEYTELKWPGKKEHFQAWRDGMTGYPIVDAAMREFKQTGWMHNRLRMVVAMFLTKDLLLDWKLGERYFAMNLLDYDLASNNGGWQWSASTGCDAQPYFRVMNPISQSERFDFDGDYIRRWVPELRGLNGKEIHWPHDLGLFKESLKNYLSPIVDHSEQRKIAIEMFKKPQRQ